VGGDRQRVAARLLTLDAPAAPAEVADDVAQELLRRHDLDREDRLEQDRLGAARGLLEGERAGDLEGDLRRVRVVVLAVHEGDAHVDHRVIGHEAREAGDAVLGALKGGAYRLRR
jgi:hypothetical protein